MADTVMTASDWESLRLIRSVLPAGTTIGEGADALRLERGNALRSVQTGRFATQAAALAAYRQIQKQAILHDLASAILDLFAQNIEDLTSHQLFTLRELAKLGHPYARRHYEQKLRSYKATPILGTPGTTDTQIVNRQDARPGNVLSESFSFSLVSEPGGAYSILAGNTAPQSRYLVEGTAAMVRRPFDEAAMEKTKQQAQQLVSDAARKLSDILVDPSLAAMPQIDLNFDGLQKKMK